ncbi:hypothetical protein [Phenylobacterium sp.]|jgi:hypothetical protein|uniref:hypothetical protein n=1 Tax=Phenylobacterium sp. TaxID=1871053 RepID=UPI002F94606F
MSQNVETSAELEALRERLRTPSHAGLAEAASAAFTRIRADWGGSPEIDQAGVAMIRACRRAEELAAADPALSSEQASENVSRKALETIDALEAALGRGAPQA